MSKFAVFGLFVILFVIQITAQKSAQSSDVDVNDREGFDSERPHQLTRKGSGGRKGRKIDAKTLRAVRSETSFDDSKCNCDSGKCKCCAKVNIPPLNVDQNGCAEFAYTPKENGIEYNFSFNNKRVLRNEVSGNQIPPMCTPLPRWPMITICSRFNNSQMSANGLRFCMTMEARFQGTVFYRLPFDCMNYAVNGISASPAPPTSPSSSRKSKSN